MSYELSHDSIARQVFEKASTEARTRRKVERYIHDRYVAYQERGAKLTQDDLEYIHPYLGIVNIEAEERAYIEQAERKLIQARRRRRLLVAAVIAVLSVISAIAIIQGQRSEEQRQIAADLADNLELQKDSLNVLAGTLSDQADSLIQKEAALKLALDEAEAANDIAEQEKIAAELAKNRADQEALEADRQKVIAQQQKIIADQKREEADSAKILAETNFKIATSERAKLEVAEAEARKQAQISTLSAYAIEYTDQDPTLALRLAYEACLLSEFQDPLAVITYHRLLNHPNHNFYQNAFMAHQNLVNTVAISPDGRWGFSGGLDSVAYIWNTETMEVQHQLEGHERAIRTTDFSPDGSYVAAGGYDRTVKIWQVSDGQLVRTLEMGYLVESITYSPDGQSIIAVGHQGQAKRWRIANGRELATAIQHQPSVEINACINSPDGRFIATADDRGFLKLWDADGVTLISSQRISRKRVMAIAFSADGNRLISGAGGGKMSWWQVPSLKRISTLQEEGPEIFSIAVSPDNQWIAHGNGTGEIRVWQAASPQQAFVIQGHEKFVSSLVFTSNNDRLISSSGDQTVKTWDLRLQQRKMVFGDLRSQILALAFSPNGQHFLAGGEDYRIRMWPSDQQSNSPLLTINEQIGYTLAVGFTADGRQILGGSADGSVLSWDRQQQPLIRKFQPAEGYPESMAFSTDGRWLAVGQTNHEIILWDMMTQQKARIITENAPAKQLLFSTDGSMLVSLHADGIAKSWQTDNWQQLASLGDPQKQVHQIAVAHTANIIAIGWDDGEFTLYNGGILHTQAALNETAISSLAFSPNDRWLFVGTEDEQAVLYDTESWQIVQRFDLGTQVTTAVFHPIDNGQLLVGTISGSCLILQNMVHALETNSVAPLSPAQQEQFGLGALSTR